MIKMTINITNVKDKLDLEIEKKEEELRKLRDRKNNQIEEVKIIWDDDRITLDEADSISFDDKKITIGYGKKITAIPLKKIKKIVFSKTLLESKPNWNWNFKSYEDSTSDNPLSIPCVWSSDMSSPFVWYKWTSNMDTAGNPTW